MASMPTKKGSWGSWAVIHNEPTPKGRKCGGCIYVDEDGWCSEKHVMIRDIGASYCKTCKFYRTNKKVTHGADIVSAYSSIQCIYVDKWDGKCSLWNSGRLVCKPDVCLFHDEEKHRKRKCNACLHCKPINSVMVYCNKAGASLRNDNAAFCEFFSRRVKR